MRLSKEGRKTTRELFRASLVNGRLDADRIRAIVQKVGEAKPRHYIDILRAYERLVRLEVGKHHASIETAVAMDDDARQQLESSLRSKYGQDLTTDFKVTPELIGGLRVKIGSDVYDSSVRERLSRLESQLATA